MQEAKVIKTKKMSSTFDITQIKSNPGELTSIVSGVLKRYVGLHALTQVKKSYVLQFHYQDSRLSIVKFALLKEKEDV